MQDCNVNSSVDADGVPMPRRVYAVLGIWCGIFLSVMNNSIANVSLPTIAAEFHIEPSMVVWVINAYQLATIMLILPFAALGEIFGYRKVYLVGVVVFSSASLACALSTDFVTLVIGRLLQGIGSAFITCVNTTLVRLVYPKRLLGRGIGLNASVVATSAAAGPAVAGALLAVCDWHFLFAINIPFGVLAFCLGWFFLPKNQDWNKGQQFHLKSSLLSAATFGLLILTVESVSHGWPWWTTLLLGLLFLSVTFGFLRCQKEMEYPMLPIDLLRIPIFSLSLLTSVCSYLAQMLALVSLPFFFQHVLNYSTSETGLFMSVWPLTIIFVAPVSGFLSERVHAGIMGACGLSMLAVGLLLLFAVGDGSYTLYVVGCLLLCGAGFAMFQTPNNGTIMASSPKSRSGSASGMMATSRLLGQTTGASLAALVFFLLPEDGPRYSLLLAASVAFVAALISCSRSSIKSPLNT